MNEGETTPNIEQKCPQCGAPLPSGVLAGLCPACLLKQGATADTAIGSEVPPFQPPGTDEVSRMFPQLEIISLLGKGGMGAVYKARQPALDRIIALKILPAQVAGGPAFGERFNREARALAKLNHPNIVAVYEFGYANNQPFFIMEFVDGLNLRQLELAGKLSPREALQIVPQICEALQFAHEEGIVHRDIKPENILVDKKGRVKIADFGIAKILSQEPSVAITETGGAIGTPHYMAPEQMEKPTTVDHRADIFSLGVVFYEMLTGELPLGKFAPPSSRKVEVDVRLDEVVLRALEKDPNLRYQHASQVKTAVDTIVGSVAPPLSSGINAEAVAQDIIARDYDLQIKSCVRRGWALVKANFWPIVGINALVMALLSFVGSIGGQTRHGPFGTDSGEITIGLSLLVSGPLMGGLYLYLLKKIRKQKTTVETAFSGFSQRYLHLFLAGFVTTLLTGLGFLCFILPGIYLFIAWMFTLPLVMDKNIDFWEAMELSRKVMTKHWWKFLGLGIVSILLFFLGLLACGFGIFVTIPLILASWMFAYEDVFGGVSTAPAPAPGPIGVGPFGTAVSPEVPPIKPGTPPSGSDTPPPPPIVPTPPNPPAHSLTPTTKIGLAAVALVVFITILIALAHHHHREEIMAQDSERSRDNSSSEMSATQEPAAEPAQPAENVSPAVFGPIIEEELPSVTTATQLFLGLGSKQLLTPSTNLINTLTSVQNPLGQIRDWEALDIPQDSRRYQYVDWLKENGVDIIYAGDGKIIGFDGIFAAAHGDSSTNWDDWDSLTPDQTRAAVAVVDWELRATDASRHGHQLPPAPAFGGTYRSAMVLDSRESGGPTVSQLTIDQSINWFFKTRTGAIGVLQLVNLSDNPSVAKIRYKLLQTPDGSGTSNPTKADSSKIQSFNERLDAATSMNDSPMKDQSLVTLTIDAAGVGAVDMVSKCLQQIGDELKRNQTTHQAALLLSKNGQKKQAIDLAKTIGDDNIRNETLSELAR